MRSYRTAKEREAILTVFRASGLSARRFAREHDVSGATLWRWLNPNVRRKRLAQAAQKAPAMLEVVRSAPSSSSTVDLVLPGDVRLSLSALPSPAWGTALAAELRRC